MGDATDSCIPCAPGSYHPDAGSSTCAACPADRTQRTLCSNISSACVLLLPSSHYTYYAGCTTPTCLSKSYTTLATRRLWLYSLWLYSLWLCSLLLYSPWLYLL